MMTRLPSIIIIIVSTGARARRGRGRFKRFKTVIIARRRGVDARVDDDAR